MEENLKNFEWYCKYRRKVYKARGMISHIESRDHKVREDIYKIINIERQVLNRLSEDFNRGYHDYDANGVKLDDNEKQRKFKKLRKQELKKLDRANEDGYFDDIPPDKEIDFGDYIMYNQIKDRLPRSAD